MDNIKNNDYFVKKLIEDLTFIRKHTKRLNLKQFSSDELLQDAMMFRLIQISENVLKLDDEFKASNPQVPWFAIKGLRNRIVHDYGNVDLTIVFNTLIHDIPEILDLLLNLSNT